MDNLVMEFGAILPALSLASRVTFLSVIIEITISLNVRIAITKQLKPFFFFCDSFWS